MRNTEDESSTYIFYRNRKLITEYYMDQDFSYISSHQYISDVSNNTISSYKKICFSDDDFKIPITNLKHQIESFRQNIKFKNPKNNNNTLFDSDFQSIKQKIEYFDKSEIQNIRINDNNILNMYEKYSNFDFNLHDTNYSDSFIDEISKYINYLNDIFNKIIIFYKILKANHFKLFLILNNITILLSEYFKEKKCQETQNISCFIDQNHEPILAFTKNLSKNDIKTQKEIIIQIYSDFLVKYQKMIKENTFIFNNNDVNDINYVFKEEILTFLKQINKMIILTFKEKQSLSNIIRTKSILNEETANEFWRNILHASTTRRRLEFSEVLKNIDSIFHFYSNYVDKEQKSKTINEFMTIHKKNESNSIEQIIEEDIKQKNYFYFELLFQIVLKNIVDQYFLISQILKSPKYNQEKLTFIKKSSILSSSLFYDEQFNFVLEIKCENVEEKIGKSKENYSKFIVHMIEKTQKETIIIPYFPLGSLDSLISEQQQNRNIESQQEEKVEITFVDKLIIILEIASALSDLHSKNEFHGNISCQSVLLSSKKDAYLNYFTSNSIKSFYNYNSVNLKEEKNAKIRQLNDIYSFGVLIHAIITGIMPEDRFEGKSENEIEKILTENYFNFIFSGNENECFSNDYTDFRGDCWIGMKEIIEKCMKRNPEERYQCIDDIINSINKLAIYSRNEREILFRIDKAYDSRTYECGISDLVESYYRGQEVNLYYIEKMLQTFQNKSTKITGDIIKNVFEVFQFIKKEDLPFISEDEIKLKENHGIFSEHNINCIIPTFTLSHAVSSKQNTMFKYSNLSLMWAYFISKELLEIHEKNEYHGALTKDNIGVYLNIETNTFIPSITFIMKMNKIENSDANQEEIIRKNQNEDINQFKKIVLSFDGISENEKNEIENSKTMKQISSLLYKYNIENPNEEKRNLFERNYFSLFYSNSKMRTFTEYLSFANEISAQANKIEIYLQNIQHIIKNHTPQKSSTILKIINLIFSLYNEYSSSLPYRNSYENFLFLMKEKKFESFKNGSIQEIIEKLVDLVQQQDMYYYIDSFSHIILKNLLDQSLFESKSGELDFNDNLDDKYIRIKDVISMNDITAYLCVDSKFNFFIQMKYNENNTLEREIKIYQNNYYSKFVIHMIGKFQNNMAIIPYYPLGTLYLLIYDIYQSRNLQLTKKKVEFSNVDKIVIILEIASALRSLHEDDQCHCNISSCAIYLSSQKDAYLGGIYLDKSKNDNYSALAITKFYKPPEYDPNEDIDKDELIKKYKLCDIYSFGVLMHEIITETPPKLRIGNKPKSKVLQCLDNFYDSLFSGSNNEYFNEDCSDFRGDCWIGMKEIIEKCMKRNPEERYQCIDDIINSINKLPIYSRNEREILFRIDKAYDSRTYECGISDLVESYYRGQEVNLYDIEKILICYQQLPLQSTKLDLSDKDPIKAIFEIFDIKSNEDLSFVFTDIFNFIIKDYSKSKINEFDQLDYNDRLLKLSIEANSKKALSEKENHSEQLNDVILPIFSLYDFVQNNLLEYYDNSLAFAFFIAKEISIIHSKNIIHGNICQESIGIYYNKETQSYIPSFILFYYFYKNKNKNYRYYTNEIIDKYKRKDVKMFHKMLHEIKGIPEAMIQTIEKLDSIDAILYYLYNFNLKNSNVDRKKLFMKNYSFLSLTKSFQISYSSFNLTYSILNDLMSNIKTNFSMNNIIIEFDIILQMINKFLDNSISYPNSLLKDNIPLINQISKKKLDENEIIQQFENIKFKCSIIIQMIESFVTLEPSFCNSTINISSSTSEFQNKQRNIAEDQSINFKILYRKKYDRWKRLKDQVVERKVEISELNLRSFEFLLTRYIFNLNPRFNYSLSVKITNKMFSKYQEDAIKADDVFYVAEKCGHNDVFIKNGNVIINIPSIIKEECK